MKCPFRKHIVYAAGRNTGSGYPLEWIASEEFEDCIRDKCFAYLLKETNCPQIRKEICTLCGSK